MAIISRIPHSIIFCFLAILLCGSITPVYSQTTEPETAQLKIAYSETVIDEVKKGLQRLEDRERQNYERELEGQRKSIDWLFSALTVVIGIVAFMGVFAPFMMFQSNRKQLQGMLDEVKKVAEISKDKISSFRSDALINETENQEITTAVARIQHDPQFDPKPGLRTAGFKNQLEKACKLWGAVTEFDPSDVNILFNAGS